uniref:H15 domain-containing protein n=1 Tax=Hippocampus comes TaxID=109280 RepID=A0A3Q2Z7I3_HIPCM
MAEEAPAAPATTPSKAAGKAKKKKQVVKRANRDTPSLSKQIVAVISESKERKGMSVALLKKSLAAKGVDVPKLNRRINVALVSLVTKGILTQTTGIGASGSFKLAKKEPATKCQEFRLPIACLYIIAIILKL